MLLDCVGAQVSDEYWQEGYIERSMQLSYTNYKRYFPKKYLEFCKENALTPLIGVLSTELIN
jgi:hypothetical protein